MAHSVDEIRPRTNNYRSAELPVKILRMSRKDWLFNLSLVLSVWGVDLITKLIAEKTVTGLTFWGPFGVVLHHNPGAMLGAFSDLPPVLRIVSLSTGGAFLVVIYLALQYLLPNDIKSLRHGMSILLGGILGNVTDRILQGAVVDFLLLGAFGKTTPAFNLADALQWVGYGMIVYALIRFGDQFWPETNFRRKIWINPTFQMKYVLILLTVGAGFTLVSGVFFFTYLKIVIDDLVIGSAPYYEKKFLVPFFITFGVITVAFVLMLVVIGRILSHRVAGPIYAFERFLEGLLAGKDRVLRFRAGDEFLHLEELAESLRKKFGTPVIDDAAAVSKDERSDY